ncbi:MAG: N-acetylmuramoyl-L-alanine amidase [Planctomycetes bacterium]|nr:N-acetylmuramoyl-L-alanine amidase [Planctomycetota bacterium]
MATGHGNAKPRLLRSVNRLAAKRFRSGSSDTAQGWFDLKQVQIRNSLAKAAIVLLITLSACTVPRGRAKSTQSSAMLPVLTSGYVLGAVRGDSEAELAELRRSPEPAAALRCAFILLTQQQPQAAIDACATVLFSRATPSPAAESFARYLRAVAFERLGQPERAKFDRARARELAVDTRLLARLDDDGVRSGPRALEASVRSTSTNTLPIATLPRASWNPVSPIAGRLDPMEKIYRLTVHHSAVYLRDGSKEVCAAQILSIQHAHMDAEKYGDIGYHFVIDPAGRVWEGRNLKWQGAHAHGSNNRGNIGICLLGNFVPSKPGHKGQAPSEVQVQALRQLLATITASYNISTEQIYCHKDFINTECPGPAVVAALADIVQDMRAAGPQSRRIAGNATND